jgi:hypothetical protein
MKIKRYYVKTNETHTFNTLAGYKAYLETLNATGVCYSTWIKYL